MADYKADSARGWYNHYKSIPAKDLAAELISATLRRNRQVPAPMKMAAEERIDELEDLFDHDD